MQIHDTIALVTGANRGIGAELVRGLLAQGASKVYAAARHDADLAALAAKGEPASSQSASTSQTPTRLRAWPTRLAT